MHICKMSTLQILKEFQTQVIAFFDELIAQFPNEGDLVVMRLFISTQMPIEDTINKLIHELAKNDGEKRQAVKDRNESFFLSFEAANATAEKYKFNHFKKLWRSGQLDNEDKRVIWQWMDTFIFLADKYVKSKG
jgi:hypothetical protein